MDSPRGNLYIQAFRKLPTMDPNAKIKIAIHISNLHKTMGKKSILKGVNLLVRKGTIHALAGLNGAGKTTTFKILLGFLRADKGKVKLLNEAPENPALRERRGYLPENFNPPLNLTGKEFLHYISAIHGKNSDLGEILNMVGLKKNGEKAIRTLSKGMIQRLGLAQAIVHNPELLILDEPFSGLDPAGRAKLKEIILKLNNMGKTILFSTHILSDITDIAETVSIMHKGRIIITASVSKLKENLSESKFLDMVISYERNAGNGNPNP